MNTVKCLTSQIEEEQRTSKAVREFWSNKYSFLKTAILECSDMNEFNFIKRNIKENTLTEETLSTYRRRKKTREKTKEKSESTSEVKTNKKKRKRSK